MTRIHLYALLAPALLLLASCSSLGDDPMPAESAAILEPDSSPVPLYAAQDVPVGEVTASDDGSTLTVTYRTDPGWCLLETHLGIGATPDDLVNRGAHARGRGHGKGHDKGRGNGHDKGRGRGHDRHHDDERGDDDGRDDERGPSGVANPAPGQFPFKGTHDCVSEYTYTIDLGELGLDLDALQDDDFGKKIVLAAHAVVSGSESTGDRGTATPSECSFAMYGVDEAGESGSQRTFYRIDDVPGQAFEPIASFEVGDASEAAYDYAIDALAFDAAHGRLYFAERHSDSSTLHFYDLTSDAFVVAGDLSGVARGATFADGGYYYVPDHGSELIRVEFEADGTIATSSEVAGFEPDEPLEVVDLAVADGVLYGSTTGTVETSVGQFFSFGLDAGTGFQKHATYGEGAFHQLAFAEDGTLYGTLTTDTVFSEIDPATGAATPLEFWPQVSFADLASGAACLEADVPEETPEEPGEHTRTETAWAGTKPFPHARNGSRYFVYVIEFHGHDRDEHHDDEKHDDEKHDDEKHEGWDDEDEHHDDEKHEDWDDEDDRDDDDRDDDDHDDDEKDDRDGDEDDRHDQH